VPDPRQFDSGEHWEAETGSDDIETVLTTAADVESAGRSCMAIVVLAALILLLLCVWIGYRSTGGS